LSSNITGHLSPDDPKLSQATRAILRQRSAVMHTWMANMRAQIEPARGLCHPVLENTLPGFFDSLAALLTDSEELRVHNDLGALAVEHGGERARLTPFNSIALIQELQLFRDALFAELDKAEVRLDHHQRVLINTYVDTAIRESVNSFVAVQGALREQFVAAMTHDLRTPLSNAQMAAQLIATTSDNPQVKQLASRIIDNTRRIDMMTRELLNAIVFAGGGELELHIAEFDMADLLREVVDYARANHTIDLHLPDEPMPGHWDRDVLHRALENLVSNAIKYGAPEPPVRVDLTRTEERVQVAVHNMGNPIAADELETIFQLYRRAAGGDERPEGWGVGLPFARKVAEAHGGSILVSSSATDGTVFVIDIPADARPFIGSPTAA
jgi:signal transduction histidine kinase